MSKIHGSDKVPPKSPYYVDPSTMTPLQKHCAFFDRNGDGLIMPWETFTSMRILGYNIILAALATALVHFFFSYWTLDSWIPDPFFAIAIKNVHRLKHGSDMAVYDHEGNLVPGSMDPGHRLSLMRWDTDRKGGLSLGDIIFMTQRRWNLWDWFGWWAVKIEWIFLWILRQRHGVVKWDDVFSQYDDTLFRQIEQERMNTESLVINQ